MNINCKYCASPIPSENINLDTLIAKCSQCGAVFGVATQLSTAREQAAAAAPPPVISTPADHAPPPPPPAGRSRPPIAMPSSYTQTEENGVLVLTRMWFNWSILFLIFFCVFWNGIVWVFNTSAIAGRAWPVLLFTSVHTLIGLGVAYSIFCQLLNNTVVRVGQGELQVTHGPLPSLARNKRMTTSDIQQLYTREVVHRGKRGRRSYTYEVCVIAGPQQKNDVLVAGFPDAKQALFLEQQIEQALGITDVAVMDEVPR